ncbi:aliphatic sulfonate ABC transporter substrate-binding protein [Novosphingobium sp. FKTRR1]|uniref:aliphatic sulfonate ABC transporter substrate-binding protein n=1 Tax=Novosphingobium sp. FKTRR1 TaxID=2879118 RepID=UPI001CF02056
MELSRRGMLAGGGALALTACTRGGSAGPIVIGYQKNGLLLLAKARGTVDATLTAAGRQPAQWIEFPSGPPMLEAMAAGSVDVGAVGESPMIFAQAAGSPVVYIAAEPVSGKSSAILVPKESPVRTLADLKGRKVAFTKASSAHLVLAKALRQAGLTFADITAVNLPPADAAGAFSAGAIDAWSIWDPFYALTVEKSGARALITGDRLPPSDAFFIGTQKAVTTKVADVRAVLAGLRATADWARDHVDESVAICARLSGLPDHIVRIGLRRGDFGAGPVGPDVLRRQQANADLYAELGLIPARVDVSKVVWNSANLS